MSKTYVSTIIAVDKAPVVKSIERVLTRVDSPSKNGSACYLLLCIKGRLKLRDSEEDSAASAEGSAASRKFVGTTGLGEI